MKQGMQLGVVVWCTGLLALSGCADQPSASAGNSAQGTAGSSAATMSAQGIANEYASESQPLGQGRIYSYVKAAGSGRPLEVGVKFGAAALQGLPMHPMANENCFDMNGDGQIDAHMECALGYEHVLELPQEALANVDTPIKYAMVDFNSMGHQPPGIYDVPHFDFHFYTQPNAERKNIRLGPCAEVVNCDDMKTAEMPLPQGYAPAGYSSVGAVMGLMGNHLLDTNGPEFHGTPFTRTWIWGTYGGKITFLEPMITVKYLKSQPKNACTGYPMPEKFSEAGYYPRQYCVDYNPGLQEFTVSLRNFSYYGK